MASKRRVLVPHVVLLFIHSYTTVGTCLNSEQVSLMRPIYIEKRILVLKQVVSIAKVVFILSGLNNGTLLYKNLSFF